MLPATPSAFHQAKVAILFTFAWTGLVVVIGIAPLFDKLIKSKLIIVLVFGWFAFTQFGTILVPAERKNERISYYSLPARFV